jgi:hypothetical protein
MNLKEYIQSEIKSVLTEDYDLDQAFNDAQPVEEGVMSELDILAKEAKDLKSFVKTVFKEFDNLPKNKETLKWLEGIYKDSTNESVNENAVDKLRTAVQKINQKYQVKVSTHPVTKGEIEIILGSGNHSDSVYHSIEKLVSKLGIKSGDYSIFDESVNEGRKSKDDWGVRLVMAINNNVDSISQLINREKKDPKEVMSAFATPLLNSVKGVLKHNYKPHPVDSSNADKLKVFIGEVNKFEKIVELLIKRPSKSGSEKLADAWRSIWNHKGGAAIGVNGQGAHADTIIESVNEIAEPQIRKIAELTGVSIDKVEKYVSSRVLNITKLLQYIKDEKQVAIRDFEKAVKGDKKQDAYFIKMFNESVKIDELRLTSYGVKALLKAVNNRLDLLPKLGFDKFKDVIHHLKYGDQEEQNELRDKLKQLGVNVAYESVNEFNTSTVNKRRAGAELKQKLKGKRSDGMGKYTGTIYGLDSNGKRVELKSLNDLNKYSEFELGESVNEAQKINPTSMKFLKGMKKIKVKGLGGYMPGVDYVYVDGDKYYFVDFEGDHMELNNTNTIKQLHKLHGNSLGESVNEEQLDEKLITFSNRAPYGQIVFMAGGAGSGKGFAINNFIDAAGFKVRDVDEMKTAVGKLDQLGKFSIDDWFKKYASKLPEEDRAHVEEFVVGKGMSIADVANNLKNPNNVAALHYIVHSMGLKDKWLINMLSGKTNKETLPNLLFDITAKKVSAISDVIKPLVDAGYDPKNIHLIWVLTDYHLAVSNNKDRKRVVPDDILLGTHEGTAKTIWSILTKGLPSGLNGRIDVILNNRENTITYKDSKGNEMKGAVKGFLSLPVKKQGGGILPEKVWKELLYTWISDNGPKTIDLSKPLDRQMGK